jgi:hypothetical protein
MESIALILCSIAAAIGSIVLSVSIGRKIGPMKRYSDMTSLEVENLGGSVIAVLTLVAVSITLAVLA